MEGIELLKKIGELEKTIIELEMMEDEAQNYAVKMKEENERLREALEFYANEDNWCEPKALRHSDYKNGYNVRTNCINDGSMPRGFKSDNDMWRVGGRRARKALEEKINV